MKSSPSKMRVIGILIVGGLLVYFSVKFFTGKGAIIQHESVQVGRPPRMESVPGSVKDNVRYKELQEKDNVRRAETAKKKGVSALPTLVNRLKDEKTDEEFFDEAGKTQDDPQPEKNTREETLRRAQEDANRRLKAQQERLDRLRQEQDNRRQAAANARQNERDVKERQKVLQDMANNILNDMNTLVGPLRNPPKQNYVVGNEAMIAELRQKVVAAQAAAAVPPPLYKAGSIIHAVLISEYNSDDAGPVRARIVSGPLAGATLIGNAGAPQNQFTKYLPVTFNTISRPQAAHSQGITVTAIDPHTQAPGIRSQVNYHYGQRYGALILSGILDQVSQQIQDNAGNNTQGNAVQGGTANNENGNVQGADNDANVDIDVTTPIATDIINSLDNVSTRPATYKIAQGTPIGLMFENDFVLEF